MKATGVVRRIDDLGRVVIPKEMCRILGLNSKTKESMGSQIEIVLNGDEIVLRKYEPGCKCCGEIRELKEFMGERLCSKCIKKAYESAKEILKGDC